MPGKARCTFDGCSLSFRNASELERHMRIHTGERPFQCKECGKAFARRACLTRHSAIHLTQKPFKCSYCTKEFTFKFARKRHEKLHTSQAGKKTRPAAVQIVKRREERSGSSSPSIHSMHSSPPTTPQATFQIPQLQIANTAPAGRIGYVLHQPSQQSFILNNPQPQIQQVQQPVQGRIYLVPVSSATSSTVQLVSSAPMQQLIQIVDRSGSEAPTLARSQHHLSLPRSLVDDKLLQDELAAHALVNVKTSMASRLAPAQA